MMKDKYIKAIIELEKQHTILWTVHVIQASGSSPRKIGAKMIVDDKGNVVWGTIGGGSIEKIASTTCKKLQGPIMISYDLGHHDDDAKEVEIPTGMVCGGSMSLYYEPHGSGFKPRVWIFGAGHIGFSLYQILNMQDWEIIIVDNRSEILTKEKFPDAERIIGDYEVITDQQTFGENDYIVIMTQGHKYDFNILQRCVMKSWKYLGVIGSKNKIQKQFEDLKGLGIDRSIIDRINSPIGIYLGGETPEEIAVDIGAKMIQVRYAEKLKAKKIK